MTPRAGTPIGRGRAERGSILIVTAVMIAFLLAFLVLVVDLGVVWVARAQAQNSADAGALAGAVARALDDTEPVSAGGPTAQAATAAATANTVIGETPGVVVQFVCPGWVSEGKCVQVDVYRDGTNGSTPLPAYFAPLVGRSSQRVKATATAQALIANASNCLRPWAVPDKWAENNVPATPETFNRYVGFDKKTSEFILEPSADLYIAPTKTDPGTGYTVVEPPGESDLGTVVTLKIGSVTAHGEAQIQEGWFFAVDLPDGSGGFTTGGDAYRDAIGASCAESKTPVVIGSYLPTETGNKVGPTAQGVSDLLALDPGASWDGSKIIGSCAEAGTCPNGETTSPRVVAIAVFDPDRFQQSQVTNDWSYCPTGGSCIRLTNIFGFFVEGIAANGDVTGVLLKVMGTAVEGGWQVGEPSAFLYQFQIVR